MFCSILLQNITEHTDKATIVELDKIKELYEFFVGDKFNLILIPPKPLSFALATLHVLFI